MTPVVHEDNELKKLLNNPAKNANEDGSMAPPLSVSYNEKYAEDILRISTPEREPILQNPLEYVH